MPERNGASREEIVALPLTVSEEEIDFVVLAVIEGEVVVDGVSLRLGVLVSVGVWDPEVVELNVTECVVVDVPEELELCVSDCVAEAEPEEEGVSDGVWEAEVDGEVVFEGEQLGVSD